MKDSPVAGWCHSSWPARPSSGQILPSLILAGARKTSTDVGVVAEVGFEYFFIPKLSIGPSFRYRHVFGPSVSEQGVNLDSNLDQFMVLGRLAYHF